MPYDLLLRGGTVVLTDRTATIDLAIEGGKIVGIGDFSQAEATQVIDAKGKTVIPGLIDTQVHFREPGLEHKEDLESGTRAAIAGGVTTVFEMPNTNPPTTSQTDLEDKLRRAEGRAWCDHAFFIGATAENAHELAHLEVLPGTPGIKIFMGSSTGSLLVPDDENLRAVLQNGSFRVAVHAEDHMRLETRKPLREGSPRAHNHPLWRDGETARLAVDRLVRLCRETGRPVHVLHVSSADELPEIAIAKAEGLPVTAEVTPQHLWFAAPEAYNRLGTLAQMNPPIRDASHRDALRQSLREGLFDVIGSDHAPHTLAEKAVDYPASPSGMPGVQTLLPAILTLIDKGLGIDLQTFVKMACEQPAAIYGIEGKGRIEVGLDADLVILDPERRTFLREEVQSKCGWSPFEGEDLLGRALTTILRGQVVWDAGKPVGTPQGKPVRFKR